MAHGPTAVEAAGAIYQTVPVGGPPQGAFLNACLVVTTRCEPLELLDRLVAIEADAGRQREVKDGPRTLDLDLLLFGDRVIADARLEVPHPRFGTRAFALVPAAEIASDWVIPGTGTTVGSSAARVGTAGVTWFAAEEDWR